MHHNNSLGLRALGRLNIYKGKYICASKTAANIAKERLLNIAIDVVNIAKAVDNIAKVVVNIAIDVVNRAVEYDNTAIE